jgi:hypothetical protein
MLTDDQLQSLYDATSQFQLSSGVSLEIEGKFAHYQDGRYKSSGIRPSEYQKLLVHLKSLSNTVEEVEISTTFHQGDIRKVVIGNRVFWQNKKRIRFIDLPEYDLRVTVSSEQLLPSEPSGFVSEFSRNRYRRTYVLADDLLRIDLTEVHTKNRDNIRTTYEVELEFLGSVEQLGLFNIGLVDLFKLVKGSHLLYTNTQKANLVSDVIAILGSGFPDKIDKDVLVDARNIKKRDLVYGGIVGNTFVKHRNLLTRTRRPQAPPNGTNYMISYKADGYRKMLIIHRTGVWLVFPPLEFNLVVRAADAPVDFQAFLTRFDGTILDGELVRPPDTKPIKYWYLAFDCIAFGLLQPAVPTTRREDILAAKSLIQLEPHTTRRDKAKRISEAIFGTLLTVEMIRADEITSPEKFFTLTKEYLDGRSNLEYKEDGIMFTPIDTVYNPRGVRGMADIYSNMENRTLVDLPDMCKWKEPIDITIDFAIKWVSPTRMELLSYDTYLKAMLPFTGSSIIPLTSEMIDHTNPLTAGLQTETVVEYEWRESVNKLVPRRIRFDKSGPNMTAIALDNWNDVRDPVTYEYITGSDSALIQHSLGDIKSALYNSIIDGKIRRGINLLYIGSSYGSDVINWRSLTDRANATTTGYIVAADPIAASRTQLQDKVNNVALKNKVRIIPTSGTDTENITNEIRGFIPRGKVDAVALLISMTDFWASDKHLDALVQTIVYNLAPGGRIIFIMLDGDSLLQVFQPVFSPESHSFDKIIGPYSAHLNGDKRTVDLSLNGEVHQEYITHITDLTARLRRYGINLTEFYKTDKERLLTPPLLFYSSMYSFGYYRNDDIAQLPTGNIPSNIILPELSLPTSSVQVPEVSKPTTPVSVISKPLISVSVPSISVPSISVPSVSVPTTSVPTTSVPTVSVPTVSVPTVSVLSVSVPTTSVPTAAKKPLQMLPVTIISRNSKAYGDDVVVNVVCTWHDNIVRIATIGDGNCFIHGVLKAYYPDYQENTDSGHRVDLTNRVRRDLGIMLNHENKEYPGRLYWETTGNGAFPRMVMQEIMDETIIDATHVDYTINGLQQLLLSKSFLGNEMFPYISDVLNVDVYILSGYTNDIVPVDSTRKIGHDRPSIVIMGNNTHYETIGLRTDAGIQTVFPHDHPLILKIRDKLKGEGLPESFDPDYVFVQNYLDVFLDVKLRELTIPQNLEDIFHVSDNEEETDIFYRLYKRLLPEIIESAKQRILVEEIEALKAFEAKK